MARTLNPRTVTARVRRALAEMHYAQRRAFEIRTGLAAEQRLARTRDQAMVAELEAHWRL